MFEEEDRELNLVLPIVLGVAVVLSIMTALFAGIALPGMTAKPAAVTLPAPSAAAAPAPAPVAQAAPAAPTLASLRRIYFATGQSSVDASDQQYLAGELAGRLKDKKEMRVAITGYTDPSGNLEQNLELAKRRAFAVRDALTAAGVAEAQLELRKPETVTGSGDSREARRVEIYAIQ